MAEMLVESLTARVRPDQVRGRLPGPGPRPDRQEGAGEEFELPAPAGEAPQVVDLMAALEASVAAAKQARSRHPTALPAPAAKKAAPAKRAPRRKTA